MSSIDGAISGLNLVMPDKADPERDQVADAWSAAGGSVTRLDRFWSPPPIERATARLYGNDTFALVVAQVLGVSLVSPADDLLIRLPALWVKRDLRVCSLAEAGGLAYPAFVKPLTPKMFRAVVYEDSSALAAECKGLEPGTQIVVSEVVDFVAEARSFILDGRVLDVAVYEGEAALDDARVLLDEVSQSALLPATCVLDLGFIRDRGWAIVEANASWGAGLNGCRAERIIPAIAVATEFPR